MRLSRNRVLSFLSVCYVDFFRGTPLLVQIVIVYFGIPQILKDIQNQLVQACGAYIAEIFRAGVQSIEKGQMEAALSLGMTHGQAMRYVILPQAFKRVIPPPGQRVYRHA